jgi:hypothetical protein
MDQVAALAQNLGMPLLPLLVDLVLDLANSQVVVAAQFMVQTTEVAVAVDQDQTLARLAAMADQA